MMYVKLSTKRLHSHINLNQSQTVDKKEINSGKTMKSKRKINLMKSTGVKSNKEQNNNKLIEKYFKDQMVRNKCN